MPTTYAHDRFGREVYEQLPANLKKDHSRKQKLYLIGLHGPDIFFITIRSRKTVCLITERFCMSRRLPFCSRMR